MSVTAWVSTTDANLTARFGVRSVEVRKVSAALLALVVIFFLLLPLLGCNRESYFKLYGYTRDDLLYGTTPREDEKFALKSVESTSARALRTTC